MLEPKCTSVIRNLSELNDYKASYWLPTTKQNKYAFFLVVSALDDDNMHLFRVNVFNILWLLQSCGVYFIYNQPSPRDQLKQYISLRCALDAINSIVYGTTSKAYYIKVLYNIP